MLCCFIVFSFFSSYSSHPVVFVFFNIMINFLYFFLLQNCHLAIFWKKKRGSRLRSRLGSRWGSRLGSRWGSRLGSRWGPEGGPNRGPEVVQTGSRRGSRRGPYGVQKGGPEEGVHVLYRPEKKSISLGFHSKLLVHVHVVVTEKNNNKHVRLLISLQ